jgi:hypothetical protein
MNIDCKIPQNLILSEEYNQGKPEFIFLKKFIYTVS